MMFKPSVHSLASPLPCHSILLGEKKESNPKRQPSPFRRPPLLFEKKSVSPFIVVIKTLLFLIPFTETARADCWQEVTTKLFNQSTLAKAHDHCASNVSRLTERLM